MKIEDKVKICEALGLDATKVVRLVLTMTPESAQVEVVFRVTDEVTGTITDTTKKYKLTPIDEDGE